MNGYLSHRVNRLSTFPPVYQLSTSCRTRVYPGNICVNVSLAPCRTAYHIYMNSNACYIVVIEIEQCF